MLTREFTLRCYLCLPWVCSEGKLLSASIAYDVILSMLSAECPGRQGLRGAREMYEMYLIQGRRDPQRRLRSIARRLRHSRTGTRLRASARVSPQQSARGLLVPVKKLPPTRAWRLDEKPTTTRESWHSASPLPTACILRRAASAERESSPRGRADTSDTAPRKTAAIFARAAAHTAKRQLLAEGVAAAMRRRRARAAHIARDHRASETTHKRRPPTRVTQTSPRALQPTHTTKPRRPSSARSRATTSKLRR